MAVTGDTELGPTKQEVITELAQRALISASVYVPSFTDFSNRAKKGAETVSIPKNTTLFTVENRASAAAGTTQDVDYGKDQMLLDVRAHIQWLIDSNDEIESTLDVQKENVERAAAEHGRDFDSRAITKMAAAAIVTTTAGDPITQDIVLEMRRVLLKNKARPGELWLSVPPAQEAALLKIDPFVSADQYGRAVVPSGVLGTLYGVKVLMTPELGDDVYFMHEKDGFGFALQMAPAFDEDKRPEYGVGAMLQVLAQKYGQQALQLGVPGAFKADGVTALGAAESAHIIQDNNP